MPRFFAVTIVTGMRWMLFFILPVMAALVLIPGTPWGLTWPSEMRPLGPFDFVVRIALVPPFFWIVGNQLRAVADQTQVDPRESLAPLPEDLEPLED